FAAAAKIRNGDQAALLQKQETAGGKYRRQTDIEATVPRKQRWIFPILLQSFFVSQEHRDLRAVLGWIPDLVHLVGGKNDIRFDFLPESWLCRLSWLSLPHPYPLSGGQIQMIDAVGPG